MATEIKQIGLGQVDRLTLLDPGTMVSDFKIDGNPNKQQGFIHKVKIYFDRIDISKWVAKTFDVCKIGLIITSISITQDDANFVDVWHTSTVGIWDESIGHVDVWANGGKSQPDGMTLSYKTTNSHKAAVYMFARTIVEPNGCQYIAAKCEKCRDVKPKLKDTCNVAFIAYEWKHRTNKASLRQCPKFGEKVHT